MTSPCHKLVMNRVRHSVPCCVVVSLLPFMNTISMASLARVAVFCACIAHYSACKIAWLPDREAVNNSTNSRSIFVRGNQSDVPADLLANGELIKLHQQLQQCCSMSALQPTHTSATTATWSASAAGSLCEGPEGAYAPHGQQNTHDWGKMSNQCCTKLSQRCCSYNDRTSTDGLAKQTPF